MGEKHHEPFQLSFNSPLQVDRQGPRVTSDGGLILVRELGERLGFSGLIAQHSTDPAVEGTRNDLWPICSASRYTTAWLVPRTNLVTIDTGGEWSSTAQNR